MSNRFHDSYMTGPRKAAIVLAVLGEDAASLVLRGLPQPDVDCIAEELANLGDVPPELSEHVLAEFYEKVEKQHEIAAGGPGYTTRLLLKAFGEEKAKTAIEKVNGSRAASSIDALRKADPQQLAKFLEAEHPQAIALILGSLESRQASTLLMKLPSDLRADVIQRLASLKHYSTEMGDRVAGLLMRRVQSLGNPEKQAYSGEKSVAELMNRLDAEAAREILELIETTEPTLAISIRDQMFTFDDFLEVPEQQIRELMGAIDKKVLTVALKGATEEIRNHFFRTMSSRAVDMLKEDTEALGPVRSKEVVKAQQEIVAIARKLEAEGKLVLRNDGDDQYVV